MSTADIQLSVVFGGQYSFEKLQSDYEQTDTLARDYIKNKPDLVNFEAETVTTETVIFDENPTGELGALKLQYNPAEKTIEFGLKDGGILQLGKEMFEEYTNIDTVPLTNGMIVSTAAIPGNRKGIKRTDFTNLTSIRSIVGMVTVDSIGTNQSGRVTTKGIINDLNTNGIAEGSQLWGNPAVLGGWSGNKPAKPQYAVQIGQVVVASATVGSVELNVAKDVKFSDLADVNGSTNLIDDTDTIPKRDADGIIREITVADIKADFKTDTDALYEPLLGFTPENVANKGQANGYASLGADGLVPSNQLPSFVDDVLEFANLAAFPVTGEQGKIYVALDTNKTYRWSGSTYIYITSGDVNSVAGKTGVVTLVKGDVGLGNVDNTSDANKPVSTAQQNALDLKIDKTLPTEITTVADNETMAVKASDSIWKRITWANIKATLKTYFETLFVTLTGAQNIAGVKTFTDSPVVPTPVNNTDAANKAFVQSVITVGNDTYQENKLITDARVASLENVINSANINQELTATASGVDTVALPKTAANTGMQVQMFGQSAQNLVVNGDFRNGTTGWTFGNEITNVSISNGNLLFTGAGDAQINSTKWVRPTVLIGNIIGNKYYRVVKARKTNSTGLNQIQLTHGFFDSALFTLTDSFVLYSDIKQATSSTGYVIGATVGLNVEIDYAFSIDLTATFGAGNEPTKEQCDVLFANYFEGTDNVLGTGRVRSVGKNLFFEPKAIIQFNKVSDGVLIQDAGGYLKITGVAGSGKYAAKRIYLQGGQTYKFIVDGYKDSGAFGYIGIYNIGITGEPTANIGAGVTLPNTTRNTVVGGSVIIPSTGFYYVVYYPTLAGSTQPNIYLYSVMVVKSTVTTTTYEPFIQSALYLTTPELRSNGLIKDEIRKGTNGYELVKRVGVGTLGVELIDNNTFDTSAGWAEIVSTGNIDISDGVLKFISSNSYVKKDSLVLTNKWYLFTYEIKQTNTGILYWLYGAAATDPLPVTAGTHRVLRKPTRADFLLYSSSFSGHIDNAYLKELTFADFEPAISNLSTVLGGNVHFTLATPVITPITHAGLLNSNSNGTTYFEPIIADAGVYASNLAVQLTDYPISSFESIRKYANGTYTELSTATAVIASGGLSFTHPDLVSGDLVVFTYAYNKESIGRSMTLTHYDSRFVIADTANSKVYRWRITSTNGVASIALTEV